MIVASANGVACASLTSGKPGIGEPVIGQESLVGRLRVRGIAGIPIGARQSEQRAAAIRRARQRRDRTR